MADLKQKVGLVIGADGRVGRGIAEGLAEAGATLYLVNDAAPEVLQAAAASVESLGGRALPLPADAVDNRPLLEVFRRIEAESGRLDLLVNDAVTNSAPGVAEAFWEHPLSVWDEQCGAGLRECFAAAALAARLMVQQGSGLIINLFGGAHASVTAGTFAGVREAGMDRMTAEMASELAGQGVTALSLAAGRLRTEPVAADSPGDRARGQAHRSARFLGRCIAALAMDPDIAEKNGGRFDIESLRREYRFSELTEEPT